MFDNTCILQKMRHLNVMNFIFFSPFGLSLSHLLKGYLICPFSIFRKCYKLSFSKVNV